jgi:hypothetical protein
MARALTLPLGMPHFLEFGEIRPMTPASSSRTWRWAGTSNMPT